MSNAPGSGGQPSHRQKFWWGTILPGTIGLVTSAVGWYQALAAGSNADYFEKLLTQANQRIETYQTSAVDDAHRLGKLEAQLEALERTINQWSNSPPTSKQVTSARTEIQNTTRTTTQVQSNLTSRGKALTPIVIDPGKIRGLGRAPLPRQ